jgi:hypothetical protein
MVCAKPSERGFSRPVAEIPDAYTDDEADQIVEHIVRSSYDIVLALMALRDALVGSGGSLITRKHELGHFAQGVLEQAVAKVPAVVPRRAAAVPLDGEVAECELTDWPEDWPTT